MTKDASLLEQLEFAEWSCGCESYYSYQCMKCKTIAKGDWTVDEADKKGYIDWKCYSSPGLTPEGKAVLKFIRDEEAAAKGAEE